MRIAVLLKDNTKIQKISCLLSWYYPDRCHSYREIQGDHVVPSKGDLAHGGSRRRHCPQNRGTSVRSAREERLTFEALKRYQVLMPLLVVEDDLAIESFVKRALVEAGYQVDTASNARTGELKAVDGIHDAFIIDLGLPDMDRLDLIVRCRAQGISAPVLILSARRPVDERVRGLEHGGDDYLTKPFALAELLARLRNLLRRSSTPQNDPVRLQAADLQLDLVRHEARRSQPPVDTTGICPSGISLPKCRPCSDSHDDPRSGMSHAN